MREINLTVTVRGSITVPAGTILGRAGEVNASRLIVDVSAWAEAAISMYSIVGRRPDGGAYVVGAALTPTAGVITADVPTALLALAGAVFVEVRGEASDLIVKSASTVLMVQHAASSGDPDACTNYGWTDELTQAATALGAQIEAGETLRDEMAELAQQTDEDAQQTAQDAEDAAESAATAGEHSQAAQTAQQGAETARDVSQGYAVDASESADRAESAYARAVGIDLVVDVVSGELRLYSAGLDSALDIVMNGNTLEVYQV